ncbi:MAG: bifunctional phosphoribosylaminoimidazolecarboxamide formyltransferase/IMP cyclohydrolase [Deltaproteobacteria bacterium]|nr:bifunctional phosphoribosylaminoimidazolecarboxamide formyltransferase/IMP cyclohydrolase [Deltaproteobacteria bacterium]
MGKIARALLSVSDKRGLVDLARALTRLGVELLSTGGTARALKEAGLPVQEVSEVTGYPEMLDGRVKTLHPKIHGAVLGLRGNPEHVRQMRAQGIAPIDLVVINLYPFEQTVARPECSLAEAVEQVDIGGPAMIRSAAKNYPDVAVVVDPDDYPAVIAELEQGQGALSLATRFGLAQKAFQRTARYDAAIANYLSALEPDGRRDPFPRTLTLQFVKRQGLRYGENPHQQAAFYAAWDAAPGSLASASQLQGKELSYNNLVDLDAALQAVAEFEEPAAVIIKHTNPCGAAVAETLAEAYRRARECDPVSAFGGVIGLNRSVDGETAREIAATFVEAVVAPGYTEEARAALQGKANLRLLALPAFGQPGAGEPELKRVTGGLLVQERDLHVLAPVSLNAVTKRAPTEAEVRALLFAWKVCKHVKSNAIVFTTESQTVGIGAGQMSRVDSARIAVTKAALPLKGTVAASDAFFPFRDGLDVIAQAGAAAVIQPGGSVRDKEVIAAADEHGLAMVFTGIRHFRH